MPIRVYNFFSLMIVSISLTLGFFNISKASISVNSIYDIWEANQEVLNKTVKNTGDKTAFVKVSLIKVENPFSQNPIEIELSIKDMAESVLVTPTRLIIPPNREADIRLYFPHGRKNSQDTYYRVAFIPVSNPQKEGFEVKETQKDEVSIGAQLTLSIVTALVIRPVKVSHDLKSNQENNLITLENKGNSLNLVNVVGRKKDAQNNEYGIRIHAEQSQTIDLTEFDTNNIKITYQTNSDKNTITFNKT